MGERLLTAALGGACGILAWRVVATLLADHAAQRQALLEAVATEGVRVGYKAGLEQGLELGRKAGLRIAEEHRPSPN